MSDQSHAIGICHPKGEGECSGRPACGSCRQADDQGAVLITGLLVLTVMTLLGLSSMRGVILQERMAGNLKEQASAFQAAEAGLQAALSEIAASPLPPGRDTLGPGSIVEACMVTDGDSSAACTYRDRILANWRSGVPTLGLTLSDFSGYPLKDLSQDHQPRVFIEHRYSADTVRNLDFEELAKGHLDHFYTVYAVGAGSAGQAKTILQTTVRR